jgi:hypothetical protein
MTCNLHNLFERGENGEFIKSGFFKTFESDLQMTHGFFSSTLTYKWAKLLYSAQLVLFYVRSLGSFISCCVNWLHGLTFVCQLSSMSLLLFQIIYVVIRLGPLGLSTAAMYACMFQLVAYACVHLCIFITMSFILMLLVWFFQLGPMGPSTAFACACVPLHTCPLIVCCIVASSMWDS